MPVDPSISLQIGKGVQPAQQQNPLGLVGEIAGISRTWAETARTQTETQTLQQALAAKEGIGHILATSPDLNTAMTSISRSPYAAFAPEVLTNLAHYNLLGKQAAQTQLNTQNTAYGMAIHAITAGLYDPKTVPKYMQAARQASMTGDPTIDRNTGQFFQQLEHSLFDGIPADNPQAAANTYRRRAAGILMQTTSPEQASRAMFPETGMTNTGGAIVPTLREPAAFGGQLEAAGQPIPLTLPPQVVHGTGPGGQPVTTPAGGAYGTPMLAGPTVTEHQYLGARGGDIAQYQSNLDKNVQGSFALLQNLQEQSSALQNFKAGAGATTYMKVAQMAQAIGAPQQLVDQIAHGNLGAMQEYQKLAVNNIANQIRQQLTGSPIAEREFSTFLANYPTINTDPRAIYRMEDFMTRMYYYQAAEQKAMEDFVDRGGNLSDWPSRWQKEARKGGYDKLLPSSMAFQHVTPGAISILMANPKTAAKFDEHFGKGLAEELLKLRVE